MRRFLVEEQPLVAHRVTACGRHGAPCSRPASLHAVWRSGHQLKLPTHLLSRRLWAQRLCSPPRVPAVTAPRFCRASTHFHDATQSTLSLLSFMTFLHVLATQRGCHANNSRHAAFDREVQMVASGKLALLQPRRHLCTAAAGWVRRPGS